MSAATAGTPARAAAGGVLVIGATGRIGRPVLAGLVARRLAVRCLVRDPARLDAEARARAEVVQGDAEDPAARAAALAGVARLFLVLTNGPRQLETELALVADARRAGVAHVVKVSAPVVGPDVPVAIARLHFEVEQAIEASGMAYTHLRPYAFMQNLLHLAPLINRLGVFFGATGRARMNYVDVRDIADVAITALTRPGSEGRAYVLTGPEVLEQAEVAARISALGRRVTYIDQSPEEYRRGLERARLPPWLVEHLLEIQALTVAQPEAPTDTVREVTGRAPRTLDAFLREHADAFTQARPWPGAALGRWLAWRHGAGPA